MSNTSLAAIKAACKRSSKADKNLLHVNKSCIEGKLWTIPPE